LIPFKSGVHISLMPDIMIPASIVVSCGVVASVILAARSHDWRFAAGAGFIGTFYNLACFLRRLSIQRKLHARIAELRGRSK
jgi:hypothetical protein